MLLIIENNNSINRIDRKLSKSIILFNIKINRDCSSISDNAINWIILFDYDLIILPSFIIYSLGLQWAWEFNIIFLPIDSGYSSYCDHYIITTTNRWTLPPLIAAANANISANIFDISTNSRKNTIWSNINAIIAGNITIIDDNGNIDGTISANIFDISTNIDTIKLPFYLWDILTEGVPIKKRQLLYKA